MACVCCCLPDEVLLGGRWEGRGELLHRQKTDHRLPEAHHLARHRAWGANQRQLHPRRGCSFTPTPDPFLPPPSPLCQAVTQGLSPVRIPVT
jgi:hypothetical protein